MENQQHAGERTGRAHRKNPRRRAGVPAKHFITRFAGLSDVPAADLELLAGSLRRGLDLEPGSPIPALHAAVHREIRRRADAAAG
ncbi:hypothetical protein Achl_0548 [Pseudarthrobacter chlorophenolicus A6]|uniref:Uncharacterized protein n=1 Tax=Pseudarthrobacter chlorophenolicus (strain ATCC 700700 / DSM 12829 / CIP 107037 / JCM 12360 / KCTC 9906 / NCIMB 13794 / A6) TaxID=452863 RepID=B8HB62_PSECP|nr:hypothetical protein Achl_0548 [Pseudarthrobacter chlorophenolicus A6]SDQ46438.1 hypothetical protein SAMN04489738_0984 [Pseudarthrobacter chlorophenolicus]